MSGSDIASGETADIIGDRARDAVMERRASDRLGILAAILSSSLGGINTAVTRFAIGATDPATLAALRFGVGFLFLLPVAVMLGSRWPRRADWAGVAALGVLFVAIFQAVFNLAIRHTTAARGALALSMLPLLTMVVAALLRAELLTARKTAGVLVAIGGVATALTTGIADAPAGAWRGDLIMVAGSLCFALYSVWSRPFIARSSPLAFVTMGMGAGSVSLLVLAWADGGLYASAGFAAPQWMAVLYLGAVGAALTFFLWVFALERTTPTRVANTITLNPVTAALLAVPLLGEPLGANLIVGVLAVGLGIWIASTDRRGDSGPAPPRTGIAGRADRGQERAARLSELRAWWPHPPPGWRRAICLLCWRKAAHDRRLLSSFDDRMLRDIGLDRGAINDESTVSFWR